MMNDGVSNCALTSLKFLPSAEYSEFHFVFRHTAVDTLANAAIVVQK
jgi:hypothetical protein